MIKCRQRAGGRGGRQRWRGKREGEGEAEREASTSSPSDVPAPSRAQPFGTRPFCASTVPKPLSTATAAALGLPLLAVTVTCPCLLQATESRHKELLPNNSVPPINPAGAQKPGCMHPGADRPRPRTQGLCDCRCESPRCHPQAPPAPSPPQPRRCPGPEQPRSLLSAFPASTKSMP